MALAAALEEVRRVAGGPLRVTSGYRPHSTGSQHGVGQAADVQADGLSPLELAWRIREAGIAELRQVIAESTGTGLTGAMGQGSGRWVHVAVLGPGYGATRSAWLESLDGRNYAPLRGRPA